MIELVAANWWLFLAALVIGIAVAWWIFAANRRTKVERAPKQDVLDEGAERAKRNQALIDASARPQPMPDRAVSSTPEPAPVKAAPSVGSDDLKRIKGVGPKLEKLLNELGVMGFAQIAAWEETDIDRIDAQLGTFEGRIRRDNWIDQAKLLAAGDIAGFEGKFGSL